jgi:hypothetical protein
MAPLQRLALALSFVLGLSAGVASAATTAAQLVELSRAGLDDDILITLIQTDGSTFQLTAADILALHRQGLSDRVIRAMQETVRGLEPAPGLPPAGPVEDEPAPAPSPDVVYVPQTMTQHVGVPVAQPFQQYYPVPVAIPVYVSTPIAPARHAAAPTYWGWGGQRRPDSWQPDPEPHREPVHRTTPDKNKGGR